MCFFFHMKSIIKMRTVSIINENDVPVMTLTAKFIERMLEFNIGHILRASIPEGKFQNIRTF